MKTTKQHIFLVEDDLSFGATSEGQKERLSHKFGIPVRILEDEPELVLKIMNEVG